ncbi:MAG: hypothetical protein ABR567_15000 [Myxococcales bacterium]
MPPYRAISAALAAGLFASGCTDCKSMKANGSAFAGLLCGGEGIDAPQPDTPPLSLCQPREVMPVFFSLIDKNDPSLAGLRSAIADLGTPVCLVPKDRTCTSDDQCAIGHCTSGLCPCQTSYSPLTDVLGISLRAMATIATDPRETPDPAVPAPGCLSAAAAQDLPVEKRNRICELRRTLDILLEQNGGSNLVNDPQVRKVLLSLLDYVQGKTDPDRQTHYDLLTPVGRMAAADTNVCDPAALWTLLDETFGYLTPQTAGAQLGAIQTLLADPYTKSFLANLSGGGGADGRDSMILLAHGLMPSITGAPNGAAALQAVRNLLPTLTNGAPQSFKDELNAVLDNAAGMLADSTGIFPPLQKLLACAGSPQVRCANPSSCSNRDDELIGAVYDILSRPESQGGVDLATLVGALKTVTTLDQTGQTGRTLRLIVQGVEGSADPNDPHEARDAVSALMADALTVREGEKLVPALSVLIEKQVVTELFSLLQDLLYTCKPPPAP